MTMEDKLFGKAKWDGGRFVGVAQHNNALGADSTLPLLCKAERPSHPREEGEIQ